MNEVKYLNRNPIGLTYKVNPDYSEDFDKVHLVFNNTGLKFNDEELLEFQQCIQDAFTAPTMCKNDCNSKNCKSALLHTPFKNLVFAVSLKDLDYLKDLIDGTVFELSLDNYLADLSVERME